ncbi:MAG TPA: hypothetical protein PLK83_00845 [Limnochordia bacterium]|nr:hypothetical protein [Limnochordia bacterium]
MKHNLWSMGSSFASASAAEGSRYTYIMILTARAVTDAIVQALDSGADNYLAKPYSLAELKAKLSVGERIVEIESRDTVIFAISKLESDTTN